MTTSTYDTVFQTSTNDSFRCHGVSCSVSVKGEVSNL